MSRGHFVVFEGIDRSGKSTQAMLFHAELIRRGWKAELMAFPNRATPSGQLIDTYLKSQTRLDARTQHLLFALNRSECIEEIKTKLAAGITIICDRYVASGEAYSVAKGVDVEWCRAIEAHLPRPDITLFIHLDPKQAAFRSGFGVDDCHETVEFLELVEKAYIGTSSPGDTSISGLWSIAIVAETVIEVFFRRFEKPTTLVPLKRMYPIVEEKTE